MAHNVCAQACSVLDVRNGADNATLATGNVMLAFAAVLLGVLVGLQRRASGGILAPIITHCTWSLTMLFALPAIFGV